jgi:hypothetical protein
MAENEITTSPPSDLTSDPAHVSLETTSPHELEIDTTGDTASSITSDQDVLEEHRDVHDTFVDPHLELLRAMFPDYDDSLLQSVLQSVGGDHNRAIDALLGMSDPQYSSEVMQDSRNESVSQLDLDEQLARRLMLEEQQAAQQQQRQQQQQNMLPYEPYHSSVRHGYRSGQSQPQPQPQTGPGDERDTMTDIQDHVSRIAETGKKTFESIFSKVKAKIQEYDKPSRAPEPPTQPQPSWSGAAASPSPRWSYNDNNREQPSYYDPNPSISSPPPPSSAISRSIPAPIPVRGYDIEPEQGDAGIAEPRRLEVEPAPDVPSPRTSMGSRPSTAIDGGKLGLLPKRPVSLLKPQESENAQELTRQDSLESNDELEYAENPFEDSRN